MLRRHEAISVGFAVGGAAVTGQEMLIVHEAARSKTVAEDGVNVRFGVALRARSCK